MSSLLSINALRLALTHIPVDDRETWVQVCDGFMLATKAQEFVPGGELSGEIFIVQSQLLCSVDLSNLLQSFDNPNIVTVKLDQSCIELMLAQLSMFAPELRILCVGNGSMYFGFSGLINDLKDAGHRQKYTSRAGKQGIAIGNGTCRGGKAYKSEKRQCQICIACKVAVTVEKAHGKFKLPFHVVIRTFGVFDRFHSASSIFLIPLEAFFSSQAFCVWEQSDRSDRAILENLSRHHISFSWALLVIRGVCYRACLSLVQEQTEHPIYASSGAVEVGRAA